MADRELPPLRGVYPEQRQRARLHSSLTISPTVSSEVLLNLESQLASSNANLTTGRIRNIDKQ